MPTLQHSPADVVSRLLISNGYAGDPEAAGSSWPAYTDLEPSSPDDCITVYDTTGRESGRLMFSGEVEYRYGIQVRVRSMSQAAGFLKADAIGKALAESLTMKTVVAGSRSYLVHCFTGIGQVISLGKESPESKRRVHTLNCMAVIQDVTPS